MSRHHYHRNRREGPKEPTGDRITRTVSKYGHQAYDAVRKHVRPTEEEKVERTDRRIRDTKRNTAEMESRNEYEKQRTIQMQQHALQEKAASQSRQSHYSNPPPALGGDMGMFGGMYDAPRQTSSRRSEPSGSIGMLRMYDAPRQTSPRRSEPSGSIGMLGMFDPPQNPAPRKRRTSAPKKRRRR